MKAYFENEALEEGTVIGQSGTSKTPVISKEYHGTLRLTIEGIGNYTGTIEKIIYIADKNSSMKNAVVTLGKIRNHCHTDRERRLLGLLVILIRRQGNTMRWVRPVSGRPKR